MRPRPFGSREDELSSLLLPTFSKGLLSTWAQKDPQQFRDLSASLIRRRVPEDASADAVAHAATR